MSNDEGTQILNNPDTDNDLILSSEIISIRVAWHVINQQASMLFFHTIKLTLK